MVVSHGRAVVLALCAACGGARQAPPTASTPAPVIASVVEPPPPAMPDPRDRVRDVVVRAIPDADVTAIAVDADGVGWATIRVGELRLRLAYRDDDRGVWFLEPGALEAAKLVRELAAVGVDFARSGPWLATAADGPLECARGDDGTACFHAATPATDGTQIVSLAPPEWLVRPSRRPRARARRERGAPLPAPVDTPITEVLDRHLPLEVGGAAIDAANRAIVVSNVEFGPPEGVLLCVASTDREGIDCASSALDTIEGLVAVRENGWLLAATAVHGSLSDNTRYLASVALSDAGLAADTLDLGGVAAEGEACEDHDGYCVWVEAVVHDVRIVAPGCVERRPGGTWSAIHERARDRWVRERTAPGPGCIERFGIATDRFVRTDCGPVPALPSCPR